MSNNNLTTGDIDRLMKEAGAPPIEHYRKPPVSSSSIPILKACCVMFTGKRLSHMVTMYGLIIMIPDIVPTFCPVCGALLKCKEV